MRTDVIAEAPVLPIWQVGTKAVWQCGHNLDEVAAAIEQGLRELAGAPTPTDIVLMGLQYARALLTDEQRSMRRGGCCRWSTSLPGPASLR